MRQVIRSAGVAKSAPFAAQAVQIGDAIYVSGQLARDAAGQIVGAGDPRIQFEKCVENIGVILEAAGASLADVVKLTLYVTDWGLVEKIKDLRIKYFSENPPATTALEISALMSPAYLMEVDVVAIKGSAGR